MTVYEQKYQAAIAELEATKMWPSNYAPPLHLIQRRLGMKVRPTHFSAVWAIVSGYALWFAPFWGLIMWFSGWKADGMSILTALGWAAFVGILFGITMALSCAWGRRKWHLSTWDDL